MFTCEPVRPDPQKDRPHSEHRSLSSLQTDTGSKTGYRLPTRKPESQRCPMLLLWGVINTRVRICSSEFQGWGVRDNMHSTYGVRFKTRNSRISRKSKAYLLLSRFRLRIAAYARVDRRTSDVGAVRRGTLHRRQHGGRCGHVLSCNSNHTAR